MAAQVVDDRAEQVGLAEPGRAVEEERVVGLARELGDRERGGVGEPVARADHEALEGVVAVERQRLDGGGPASPPGVRLGRPPRDERDALRAVGARRAKRAPRRRSRSGARPRRGSPGGGQVEGATPCTETARSGSSQSSKVDAGRPSRSSSRTRPRARRGRRVGGVGRTARDHRTGQRRPAPAARPTPQFAAERIRPERDRVAGLRRGLYCLAGREADLAAQEAQAGPDPRVSRPDAHALRPRHHQAPAPQGPQAADAVSAGSRPRGERRKRGRLSRSGDFDRVYRERPVAREPLPGPLRVPARRPRDDGEDPPRGLGEPQGRRRRRAQCGEAGAARGILGLGDALPAGHDFVLVARPDVAGLIEREGTAGVATALERVASQRPARRVERSRLERNT